MPEIRINGETRDVEEGASVADLLATLGVKIGPGLIVERNGKVLPRDRYADISIFAGDTMEVIRVMGGG